MRQRFMQVLQSNEDEGMTDVVLRFWTRAKPLPVRAEHRPAAPVVDMAQWIDGRRGVRR
jgi:hypothetical protein